MDTLPRDLHYYICRYLEVPNVIRWESCNHHYRSILSNSRLWKMLFERDVSSVIVPQDYRRLLVTVARLWSMDRDPERLLIFAVNCGYEKMVNTITSQVGCTGYFCNNQALEIALKKGRLDIVRLINTQTDAELQKTRKMSEILLRNWEQPSYQECLRYYFSDIAYVLSLHAVCVALCSNDPLLAPCLRTHPVDDDSKLVHF